MQSHQPSFASNTVVFFIASTLLAGCVSSGGSQVNPQGPMQQYTARSGLNEPPIAAPQSVAAGSASLPATNLNLYVANQGNNTVTVYAPGSNNVLRTISQGMNKPDALAFGRYGYLYVANYGNNTVTVYAPGKKSVRRTISQGVGGPIALAFGPSDNLYVLNGGTVTVYAPGSNKVLRTISQGVDEPNALAFDGSGNLHVANSGHCTVKFCFKHTPPQVTIYAPGHKKVLRTIFQGVSNPLVLAFGP